jgi:ABC-2 type transport system permease protein
VRALRGLLRLSWIETKIFLREPLGVIGSLGMPVLLFLIFGRMLHGVPRPTAVLARLPFNITIVSALLIALGSVQSLIAIMAIYREGGILKRLRATPLSPVTILGAHVLV